ncbi:phage tail protein [Acinetobacter gerneri]|uniref:phage tail protein n=1 Tax=Acinetobacter gerneri TaxID=202952 RepID=UPI002936342F|nr:phage tail protein [Acinetobacter gerneri]MDV2438703.1 phage tail protein [Acinetobacter gerneri]
MSNNIPIGMKTPGSYFDVNTNTPRLGLPLNTHKVLFVTADIQSPSSPKDVYDKGIADKLFGEKSEAGRMIAAAVKSNRFIDAQAISLNANSQPVITTETDSSFVTTENNELIEP